MASLMQLDVLSPDEYVFKADNVSLVQVETTGGGLGILPHHATMIVALKRAPLKYRDDKGEAHYLCVEGGFLEMKNNKVTIMSVAAETAESIDVTKARADMKRAQDRIDNPVEGMDPAEVEAALQSAEARLKTVQLATARE